MVDVINELKLCVTTLDYAAEHPGWADSSALACVSQRLQRVIDKLTPKTPVPLFWVVVTTWLNRGYAVEIEGKFNQSGQYRRTADPVRP